MVQVPPKSKTLGDIFRYVQVWTELAVLVLVEGSRYHGISRGAHKLARTPRLSKTRHCPGHRLYEKHCGTKYTNTDIVIALH